MSRGGKLFIVLAVVVLAMVSLPKLNDYLTIRNADPVMVKLAQEAKMTRQGELLFLRTSPSYVSNETAMKQACPFTSAGWLGCYRAGRIYLLKLPTDLHDLEVATADYEMLHVVYENLNGVANSSIESNWSNASPAMVTNYTQEAAGEPSAGDEEKFSLSAVYGGYDASLGAYYAPYISDLATIVADFAEVTTRQASDEAHLTALQSQINTEKTAVATALYDTSTWIGTGNQTQYNYNYNIYSEDINRANALIDQYNGVADSEKALIKEYNTALGY
jgi:hypothetical protein